MHKTSIVPLYQKLMLGDFELDENERTIEVLEIAPNTVLNLITFDEDSEEAKQRLHQGKKKKKIEIKIKIKIQAKRVPKRFILTLPFLIINRCRAKWPWRVYWYWTEWRLVLNYPQWPINVIKRIPLANPTQPKPNRATF